ncbi:MAG: nucleotidyltransferase domain-containing protein [Candidatus Vogelbacteria bacterium]|nr:nucleotidyltransferase domain-containing protein [Candidatus Vogelbacteria bacterium]
MVAVSPKIKQDVAALAEKYGLTLVVLFGSQVSGLTHKESDVDVAYRADKKLSFDDEVLLNFDLTEVFKNDKVSLVNFKTAPPLLLKQIVTNVIVLYERTPHLFTETLLRSLRAYDDAMGIFELTAKYVSRRVDEYRHAG